MLDEDVSDDDGPTRGPVNRQGHWNDMAAGEPAMEVGGYQIVYDLLAEQRLRTWMEQGMKELSIPLPGTRYLMVCPAEVALRRESSKCRLLDPGDPEMEGIGYFHLTPAKIGDASVTISRTGYTGDLGYEVWVDADDAIEVWDRLFEVASPYGVIPAGQNALLVTRVEAGLILIDVDFQSARYAWSDDQRATPLELGMGWMFRDLAEEDRPFIGRRAIEKEVAGKTSRWRTVGIIADWQDWNRVYTERGLIPPALSDRR